LGCSKSCRSSGSVCCARATFSPRRSRFASAAAIPRATDARRFLRACSRRLAGAAASRLPGEGNLTQSGEPTADRFSTREGAAVEYHGPGPGVNTRAASEEVTMRPEELHRFLNQRPFVPFRLYLSDGSHYDIRNPALVLPGSRSVIIGFQ